MLTSQDWIARAEAGGAGEVADHLAGAERAARHPDDWIEVAEAWLRHGDRERARRCLTSGLELAAGEHWPIRRAARLLAGPLADRDAAAAALTRIEHHLATPGQRPFHAYQWVLLAEAWRDVLGDRDRAARALAAAAPGVREPRDLADLARGHANLLDDADGARALLARADQAARDRGPLRELWTVAIGWREALGDDTRARAALAHASDTAGDVDTLAAMAVAWHSMFGDAAAARAALARAEQVAGDPRAWLRVAEAYFDGGHDDRSEPWDRDGVRRALQAALSCQPPPTAGERDQIATGFRHWLDDAERAEQVAPAGPPPEHGVPRQRALDGWDGAAPRALLDHLRARLDDHALERLAIADYGMDHAKHRRALADIRASGRVPAPLTWYPLEVLELTRWKRGAAVDHVARGFACALLALDQPRPDSHQSGHLADVLGPLLESCWALGLDAEVKPLLVWLAEVSEEEALPWALVGLLLHVLRTDPADPRAAALLDAAVAAEEQAGRWGDPDGGWLLRTSHFDQSHDLWRALAGEVLDPERSPVAARLRGLLLGEPG